MILELSNDTENQTAFEIQAYFNSTQSKWSLKRLDWLLTEWFRFYIV